MISFGHGVISGLDRSLICFAASAHFPMTAVQPLSATKS